MPITPAPRIPFIRSLHLTLTLTVAATFAAIPAAAQDIKPEPSMPARLASQSLLLDVAKAGPALVAVGERGHILTSTDAVNWKQSQVPVRALLTGVHFADAKHGWAVGHDAVILHTADGGATWKLQRFEPEAETPLLDVWFADAARGFAIGAYGSCFRTEDGGATWEEHRISEDDFHLNQIASSASGKLYIAAESGNAFRSDDGGESWTPLELPYEGSMFGVLPLEGDTVLLFGLRGHLFRSDDAGGSWTQIETGTLAMLNGGARLADGRIVIVGLGGTLLESQDGGRTFRLHQQESRSGLQMVVPVGNVLVLAGEAGVRTLPVSALGAQ